MSSSFNGNALVVLVIVLVVLLVAIDHNNKNGYGVEAASDPPDSAHKELVAQLSRQIVGMYTM
jgi:hypothetical protein